ncbi:MAG: exonuclease SbcCD subunit D [Chloroflexota bacterium]
MKARFLHVADCHLGYQQYNRVERFNDFARAFSSIINVAIEEQVDFVLLAGDLFHKRSIDALSLDLAISILRRLQKADIPCIAVEGNHELSYYDHFLGWVQFLARQGLLKLLSPQWDEGAPQLLPYQRNRGAYIDPVPGCRIYGMKYMGSSTARTLADYAEALASMPDEGIEYTIFMAHTGVEGVLSSEVGGLTHRQLAVLRPHVDYLALGHIHKPFDIDNWIYNPGSPESCSFTEAEWKERGYYLVEVDTDGIEGAKEQKHKATLHANPRRTFHHFTVKVDHYPSPAALLEYCQEFLLRKARDLGIPIDEIEAGDHEEREQLGRGLQADDAPVVELLLMGVLPFNRADLELRPIEEMLQRIFKPLYLQVRNLSSSVSTDITTDERMSRPELEQQVLTRLFSQDARFSEQDESWAKMAITLKNLSLSGSTAENVLETLSELLQGVE